MIAIRPLDSSQIEQFVLIHLKCWEETYYGIFPPEVMKSRWNKKEERINHIQKRILQDSNYFYYCLYDDFNIVGILIFSILDEVGILDAIYIKKEYQKQGYGIKFLNILENILIHKGIKEYVVYVLKIIDSNSFFQRCGMHFLNEDYVTIHGQDYQEIEYGKKIGEAE